MNRIFRSIYYIKWWLFLYAKVTGRIKLRGNLQRLRIGRNFKCDGDLWLGIYYPGASIVLGNNISASGPLIITSIDHVEVKDHCLFGPNVIVCDHLHGNPKEASFFDQAPSKRSLYSPGPIAIEEMVHIGANSVILGDTLINKSVVVGSNSVIKGILDSNSVYVGAIARKIKYKK